MQIVMHCDAYVASSYAFRGAVGYLGRPVGMRAATLADVDVGALAGLADAQLAALWGLLRPHPDAHPDWRVVPVLDAVSGIT